MQLEKREKERAKRLGIKYVPPTTEQSAPAVPENAPAVPEKTDVDPDKEKPAGEK